ncbi:MAG: aminotransferase class V-fold PLP-dependent enzyme [Acidiferrobacterales bacterium]|nr:aminotransferase class V-fold PLP-dependent enzyme [Acidiferrobacterales bacterium]
MSLLPDIDPDGLLEFSVVFTDRSLNHMSSNFQAVMKEISGALKQVYQADATVIVPGGGTYGMEAVARQFASNEHCLVIRNGWFSYRWTQIFEMGSIPASSTVLAAQRISEAHQAAFAPHAIEKVVETIRAEKPAVVFAPHVETSAGMILPDSYLKQVADAVHENDGLFVLDCIASGAMWVDMKETGVDILISAPQKGWSASPSSGLVMLGQRALDKIENTTSSSFACDLKKWHQIMQAYENGGHAYHATMPTDALVGFRNTIREIDEFGFDNAKKAQAELGEKVRAILAAKNIPSVAAEGFQAPGVVVSYTDVMGIHNGSQFAAEGMQIAAGVPLMCNEPEDFRTFRLGLFGLDKLKNIDRSVSSLAEVLNRVI